VLFRKFGNLVGKRLDFQGDRRGNFLADANDLLDQLGHLRRCFGAMVGVFCFNREFLRTHGLELILAQAFDEDLLPVNALAVLGRLRQPRHLAVKLECRRRPLRKVVVALLEFVRCGRQQDVADTHLHAAHRRLCLGGVLGDRLLPCGVVGRRSHIGAASDLQIDHDCDHHDRQSRRDRELGSDF
jgi:hypothetical protein